MYKKIEVSPQFGADGLIVEDHECLLETIECPVERGWRQAARGLGTFRF